MNFYKIIYKIFHQKKIVFTSSEEKFSPRMHAKTIEKAKPPASGGEEEVMQERKFTSSGKVQSLKGEESKRRT